MKRYYPRGGKKAADMYDSNTGEWVKYEDYKKEKQRLIEKLELYKQALSEIVETSINSFFIEAKVGKTSFTGHERYCTEQDVLSLVKIAKKALGKRPMQKAVSISELSEEERNELATVLQKELDKLNV